jgi:hypothetical protein
MTFNHLSVPSARWIYSTHILNHQVPSLYVSFSHLYSSLPVSASQIFWQNHEELASHLLHAGFLLDPEDGGDMFFWNFGWFSMGYVVLYPKDSTFHNHRCENSNFWINDCYVAINL